MKRLLNTLLIIAVGLLLLSILSISFPSNRNSCTSFKKNIDTVVSKIDTGLDSLEISEWETEVMRDTDNY